MAAFAFDFQKLLHEFLGGAQRSFKLSDFMKVFKMVLWVRVGFICVQLCMKK